MAIPPEHPAQRDETRNRWALAEEGRRTAGLPVTPLYAPDHDLFNDLLPRELLEAETSAFLSTLSYRPDPKGTPAAREAIAATYRGRYGHPMSMEELTLTSGTSESYLHLFRLLSEEGGVFLCPRPSYPLFEHLADHARAEIAWYDLVEVDGWRPDLAGITRALETNDVKALVFVSPHHPTGSVVRAEEWREIEKLATRHGVALILDEVFCESVVEANGDPADPRSFPRPDPSRAPVVILLNGASKPLAMPWLKVAWIHVAGSDHRACRALRESLEFVADHLLTVTPFAQHVLPSLLSRLPFLQGEIRTRLRTSRELLLEGLAAIPGVTVARPEGGVMAVPRFDASILSRLGLEDEEDLAVRLLERTGVACHPGYFYDIDETRIRLVTCWQRKPQEIERALGLIATFLSS